jgi:hypothetical protein
MGSVTSDLVPQTLGGNDSDLIADTLVDLEVKAELGVVSTVMISNCSQTHLPSCSMFSSLDLNVSPSTRVRTIVEDSKESRGDDCEGGKRRVGKVCIPLNDDLGGLLDGLRSDTTHDC